ncbi:hypothetical protein QU481_17095 [Crenobacter sp. SG2303]|uniref:Uncharacterized protein n=1 Tax=Crenobacter oryzisoli TaxID=3056844 RepID=A0ABT7XS08_9NEIS|nr:hypothetical protein [Crenobacter sp. SG2303]MDN0076586.1 hypothetical protein [Crenobacter sp. SG2303]
MKNDRFYISGQVFSFLEIQEQFIAFILFTYLHHGNASLTLISGAFDAECRAKGYQEMTADLLNGHYFKRDGRIVDLLGDVVTLFQFFDFH